MIQEDIVELFHTKEAERLWQGIAKVLRFYFRIEVTGHKNIPKTGPVIIIPNHSGVTGFDQVMLAHMIRVKTKRKSFTMAHRAYFDLPPFKGKISESFGLRKASIESGHNILKQNKILVLFPEGECGNFKASLKAYHLQKFHTGFLRLAVMNQVPIIPCTITGAEESTINLGNINLNKYFKNIRIPIPLNLIPLPSKWRIRFWDSIDPSRYSPDVADDNKEMLDTAKVIRRLMQIYLHQELKKRKYIYFPMFR